MNSKTTLVILLCCALFIPLAYTFAAPTAEPADRHVDSAAWQHLALPHEGAGLDGDLFHQINRSGNDGWQLFGVTPIAKDGTTVKTVYYFKRPK